MLEPYDVCYGETRRRSSFFNSSYFVCLCLLWLDLIFRQLETYVINAAFGIVIAYSSSRIGFVLFV